MEKFVKTKVQFTNNFGYVWGTSHPGFQSTESEQQYRKVIGQATSELSFEPKLSPSVTKERAQQFFRGDEDLFSFREKSMFPVKKKILKKY